MLVYKSASQSSSTSSLAEHFLPHFASEDEDWRKFAWLLDVEGLPTATAKGEDDNDESVEEDAPIEMFKRPATPPPVKRDEEKHEGSENAGGVRVSARLQQIVLGECLKKKDEEKTPEKRPRGKRMRRTSETKTPTTPVKKAKEEEKENEEREKRPRRRSFTTALKGIHAIEELGKRRGEKGRENEQTIFI